MSRLATVSILSEQHLRRHWVAVAHAKHTTSVSNVRLPAPSSLVGDLEKPAALWVQVAFTRMSSSCMRRPQPCFSSSRMGIRERKSGE
jgi:hypothetical protein